MFWELSSQNQSVNELINKANEHWQQSQHYLLKGNDEGVRQECLEVVRLCQLSIQANQQMGDAYVMLADALLSLAIQVTMHVNPDSYYFFLSGAAAVIHLWRSFPYESYAMPEKKDIGERLWRVTIMELMQIRAQPQQDVIKYMDLGRDKLATAIISPASYEGIRTKLDSARRVIDPLYKKSTELRAIAIQCELNTNELIDEISASMQAANDKSQNTVSSFELNTNELIDDWSSWLANWWWIFLEQWGRKCLTKWSEKI